MPVTFTRAAVSNVTHNQAELLIDYTGDLQSRGDIYPDWVLWYFRPRGGSWSGYWRHDSTAEEVFQIPASNPRYRGIWQRTTPAQGFRTGVSSSFVSNLNLRSETDYEFWVGIGHGVSDRARSALSEVLPTSPPPAGATFRTQFFGTATLTASISGTFTTTRFQALRITSRDINQTDMSFMVLQFPRTSGSIYSRFRRLNVEDFTDGSPVTTIGGSGSATYPITIRGLYPNRRYQVQISEFPDYNPALDIEVQTENFVIQGIQDPSLSFDQTVPFWRGRLGLNDWNMLVGELPAGYIDRRLPDPQNPDANVTIEELGRELARRIVAGAFERSDGSWRFISKTFWPELPVAAEFTSDRFTITEQSLRNELRDRLAFTRVIVQVYIGNETEIVGNEIITTGQTIVSLQNTAINFRKIALRLDNTLSIQGVFTFLPDIPGTYRENTALVQDDVPLILLADVQAVLGEGVDPNELHSVEPGQNLTIEIDNTLHTGTLMNKRVFGSNYGNLMQHRMTIWVHSSRPTDLVVARYNVGDTYDEGKVYA